MVTRAAQSYCSDRLGAEKRSGGDRKIYYRLAAARARVWANSHTCEARSRGHGVGDMVEHSLLLQARVTAHVSTPSFSQRIVTPVQVSLLNRPAATMAVATGVGARSPLGVLDSHRDRPIDYAARRRQRLARRRRRRPGRASQSRRHPSSRWVETSHHFFTVY